MCAGLSTNTAADNSLLELGQQTLEGKLFHLDRNGKACFTRKEAKVTSDYIAEMNLDERVRACLQKKAFELPQVSEKVSMVYCNDERYGKMNVLWVCGVLRLEKNSKSTAGSEEGAEDVDFNAWPAEEANEKMNHSKRLALKYSQIYNLTGGYHPVNNWWEYDSDESSDLGSDTPVYAFGEIAGPLANFRVND